MAQTPVFAPGSPSALAYLSQLLQQRNVDPQAAGSVFNVEGASGGIGDGGHAFGPGQFNDAGGVWTGRYSGMSPEQKNAQAWSQSGLQELARHVADVSAGLHGADAVNAIVTRFERPADPQGEIARALGQHPRATASGPAAASGPLAVAAQQPTPIQFQAAQQPDRRAMFAQALMGAISPTGQLDQQSLLAAVLARRAAS